MNSFCTNSRSGSFSSSSCFSNNSNIPGKCCEDIWRSPEFVSKLPFMQELSQKFFYILHVHDNILKISSFRSREEDIRSDHFRAIASLLTKKVASKAQNLLATLN
jgi:hypothetical protein